MALAPLYYLVRHSHANPLAMLGYIQLSLVSWKRIHTLWLDPDRGLLTLWPLALPCLAATVLWFMRRPFRVSGVALIVVAYLCFTQLVMSTQANWNSGASHLIQRYSVWFVPLAWFPLRRWLEFISDSTSRYKASAAAALVVLGACSPSSSALRCQTP